MLNGICTNIPCRIYERPLTTLPARPTLSGVITRATCRRFCSRFDLREEVAKLKFCLFVESHIYIYTHTIIHLPIVALCKAEDTIYASCGRFLATDAWSSTLPFLALLVVISLLRVLKVHAQTQRQLEYQNQYCLIFKCSSGTAGTARVHARSHAHST